MPRPFSTEVRSSTSSSRTMPAPSRPGSASSRWLRPARSAIASPPSSKTPSGKPSRSRPRSSRSAPAASRGVLALETPGLRGYEPATIHRWVGRLSRVALLHRHCEYDHANKADQARHPEWERGRDLPEQPADERGGRDGEASDEVIQADGTRPERRRREIHDQRLAGRLTDLAETAHDERGDERREVTRQHHGDGEERKGDERGEDERLAANAVCEPGHGNVTHDRRGHLHGHEDPVGRRADPDHVDRVEHEEDVHETLAGADEDVRGEDPAKRC